MHGHSEAGGDLGSADPNLNVRNLFAQSDQVIGRY
jgi:hypothetical protein